MLYLNSYLEYCKVANANTILTVISISEEGANLEVQNVQDTEEKRYQRSIYFVIFFLTVLTSIRSVEMFQ